MSRVEQLASAERERAAASAEGMDDDFLDDMLRVYAWADKMRSLTPRQELMLEVMREERASRRTGDLCEGEGA